MIEKKKLLIASISILLVLIFGLVGLFSIKKRQTTTLSPLGSGQSPKVTQEKEQIKLTTYKDEAGFEFAYPEDFIVKDVSGDDPTTYSSLEISSSKHEGKMLIKITDTSFVSVDTWLRSQEATSAGLSREITLAMMPASQIQFDNPRRLVTVVINEGIMYFIQSPLDKTGFWNKIHNEIVSSFTLAEAQTQPSTGGGEEVIYEEEEIIE